jgi:catechol 2,3-dioxygenase-like lactoylglutathione lyase family enzyme
MDVRAVTPILNVSDIEASIDWFEKLGWRAGFRWCGEDGHGPPTFASVRSGDAEIFLCLSCQGPRGEDGVWTSWWLDAPADVDAAYASALDHGMEISYPPTDEPWNVREFHLHHPDGHTFRVGSGLSES